MEPEKNIYTVLIVVSVIAVLSLGFSGYIFFRQQSLTQAFNDFSESNQRGAGLSGILSAPIENLKEISGTVQAINGTAVVVSAHTPAMIDISNPNPPSSIAKDYVVTVDRSTVTQLVTSKNPDQNSRPEDLVSAPMAISVTEIKVGDAVRVTSAIDIAKINTFIAQTFIVFR